MNQSYITMERLIAHLKEKRSESRKESDILESILSKQKTENKDELIFPFYVQSYSEQEQLHLIHYYMSDYPTEKNLESQYYCGETSFELRLTDNSRLFNVSFYKANEELVPLTRMEQVNKEFVKSGIVLVELVMTLTTRETKRWMVVKKEHVQAIHYVILGKENGDLHQVLTASEASLLWGFERSAVRKAIERGRFMPGEARKSEGTWMVTYRSMQRVFGSVPNIMRIEKE